MDDLLEVAQPAHGNYPHLYARLFAEQPVELLDIAVHLGDTPASLADADVWLATGSRVSVYDDIDWIATALQLVHTAIAEEVPLVGICFGHQLIAQALGGRVARADIGWGLGAQVYDTVERLDWFPEAAEQTVLIASHRDQVVEVPDGTTVWSRSGYCPIAGMRIGDRAWSVQGHPEFTPPVVETIYDFRRPVLGDDAVDLALSTLSRPLSNRALAAAVVRFAGR
jgi:GMP synthase-like glutamine amidotransferase